MAANPDSILDSTKKAIGLGADYDVFDLDILMHINTAFSTLSQLGVGPEDGFVVEDDKTSWSDYLLAEKERNMVKSYVYLRVRLLFDPPETSYLINAFNDQVKELEWRLNVHEEGEKWTAQRT